jgi:hypothetical protein
MTKLTDQDRKSAQMLAKHTADQRVKMKNYRSKASAYNMKAN